MKSKITALILVLCTVLIVFSGCSTSMYKYDDYSEFIQLGDYTNLEILQSEIDKKLLETFRTSAKSTDKVTYSDPQKDGDILIENGDTANIDFTGYIDGKEFSGGTGKGYDLIIGSGSFINGFEDGLIGYGLGDSVSLNLKFPDPYPNNTAYSGKDVVFVVKINKITRDIFPLYNDDNVKEYTDYETVEEFENANLDKIKNDLLWQSLYKSSKIVKYPEKELKEYYYSTIDGYTNSAAMMGVTIDAYAGYMGYTNMSDFYKYTAYIAQNQVKQELIVLEMIKKESSLAFTEEEYNIKAEELWKEYVKEESFEGSFKKFKKEFDRTNIEITLYYDVVIDYIKKTATIKDDVTLEGFVTNRYGTRYYIGGVAQTGWIDIGESKYYFDTQTQLAYKGSYFMEEPVTGEEKYLEFGEKGLYKGLADGIIKDTNGKSRYFDKGVMITGWKELDLNGDETNETYYFNAENDGYMATQNTEINGLLEQFDNNGVYKGKYHGFLASEQGIRYYNEGVVHSGWLTIDKDDDGDTEKYYFSTSNNYMLTGYHYVEGEDGVTLYRVFGDDGVYKGVFTGTRKDSNGIRRFESGVLQTGEITLTEGTDAGDYYFDPENEGYAVIGWREVDGEKYRYYESDGKMAKSKTLVIDSVEYVFNQDGSFTANS